MRPGLMRSLKTPIKVGSYYIDCGYIPRVCIGIHNKSKIKVSQYKRLSLNEANIEGRSLIDGSIGFCSLYHCGLEKVDKVIAERWAKTGPLSKDLKEHIKQFYAGQWGNGRKIWWSEEVVSTI